MLSSTDVRGFELNQASIARLLPCKETHDLLIARRRIIKARWQRRESRCRLGRGAEDESEGVEQNIDGHQAGVHKIGFSIMNQV